MIDGPTNTYFLKTLENLRKHPDIIDKKNIQRTYSFIGNSVKSSVYFPEEEALIAIGDDAAAIVQKDGSHLLFAAEGIVSSFLEKDPWFAGYSAVMVNISDICAMGGLPIAVTDTIHTYSTADSKLLFEGMLTASQNYGVPIVGGHTCYHTMSKSLSVSITGKATSNLLTSFGAQVGQSILQVVDLEGSYYKNYPFWNASTTKSKKVLQQNTKLLHKIANKGWCTTAKDISMGGLLGTLLMLMNTSKVGVNLVLENVIKPKSSSWEKWLSAFPSYGYLLVCDNNNVSKIQQVFAKHNISCEAIGIIIEEENLIIETPNKKIKF